MKSKCNFDFNVYSSTRGSGNDDGSPSWKQGAKRPLEPQGSKEVRRAHLVEPHDGVDIEIKM